MNEISSNTARPYSHEWFENACAVFGETVCRELGLFEIPEDFLLSVVMPVFNEEKTLHEIVARVAQVPIPNEILLIDDFSRDKTRETMEEIRKQYEDDPLNTVRVFFHEINQGKGAALRTGFQNVQGNVVIIQDADLEYDPNDYPKLIRPIIEGKADVVYGSRYIQSDLHRVVYFWHTMGNKVLTFLSNCFTNLRLTDMETCYKVFRRECLEAILPKLQQNRFGFEPEVTTYVARGKLRVYEIAVSYEGRSYAEGKKIGCRDGFKAIWCIVKYGLFAR